MSQVTVIVPVYNMSKYIDRCIDSVLRQSYRKFQLLLLDDGSTDDSLMKCRCWNAKDERVQVISKPNTGLGPTRNLGVELADTEYVTFLDADDWWDTEYLQLMIEGTEQGLNDIVLCDINFVEYDERGELKVKASNLRFNEGRLVLAEEWNLLNRARTFMWGKLYRRSLFADYGIKQPPHAYEDVPATPLLLAQAEAVYYVHKPLYNYLRNRKESIVNDFLSLRPLLQSLSELKQNFMEAGLVDIYYAQLRQLFWGQLCFIVNRLNGRFLHEDAAARELLRNDSIQFVISSFPELSRLLKIKYFAGEEVVLRNAAAKIAFNAEQVLTEQVTDKDNIVWMQDYVIPRGIWDKDTWEWNIADNVFRDLFIT